MKVSHRHQSSGTGRCRSPHSLATVASAALAFVTALLAGSSTMYAQRPNDAGYVQESNEDDSGSVLFATRATVGDQGATAESTCSFNYAEVHYPEPSGLVGIAFGSYTDCGVSWFNQATLMAAATTQTVKVGSEAFSPETTSTGTYDTAIYNNSYRVRQFTTNDAGLGLFWLTAPTGCSGIGTRFLTCDIWWPVFVAS